MAHTQVQVEHIAFREWLVLGLLLLILAGMLSHFKMLERMDLVLYDRFMQLSTRQAREDILIVAIDDFSLSELGKWPWPRQRHAELIQRLHAAKPLAIGLDILFTEEEAKHGAESGDQQLAEAMTQANNVILPMASENTGRGLVALKPIPLLAQAARQISHIHLELDKDGVTRSIFLREGMAGEWWSHFALSLKNVAQNIPVGAEKYLPGARLPLALRKADSQPGFWQRDYQMHIPFAGSSGHFQSIPYASVLRGEVPAEYFKNKYIIIGPTALGMADSYPTPVTGNDGVIAGVEINANILASLLDEHVINHAELWQVTAYNLAFVILVLAAYQLLSPSKALLITVIILGALLVCSFFLMRTKGWWFPPCAGLLCLLIAYPIWSWRRLEAAFRYLGEEFTLLEQEPHLLPEFIDVDETKLSTLSDRIEQRINAMRIAADRVRDLRQFVSDSLSSLPDATLVTTTDGNVLLSNQPAMTYFASLGFPKINDSLVPYLFAKMSTPQNTESGQSFSWWDILDLKRTASMKQGIEVRDPQGLDLLIKSAPCFNADKHLVGWIVSVINITTIRAAERSRDETLHFISHDMRAPQASILALLELQKDTDTALPAEEFMTRIEKASRVTLGLADNFVQLARAESQDYRFEDTDFQAVVLDASEEMWTLAKSKNIRIKTDIPDLEFPVHVDRALMTRTLTNLISNAIKYSPRDTTITCALALEQQLSDITIICTISDQGYGIPRAEQGKLFQRFQRFRSGDQPKNDGIGLGMVFVKAVLDRHHAQISFTSVPNEGTTFTIRIPGALT